MTDKPPQDPDLEDCMLAAVDRGEFATLEQARAEFRIKLDRSIEQANAGQLEDIEIVWARLRRGLADLPHAAERKFVSRWKRERIWLISSHGSDARIRERRFATVIG